MYVAVDIGGTKTLLALFSDDGVVIKQIRLATDPSYSIFLKDLAATWQEFEATDLRAAGVAIPGKPDRTSGVGIVFGNLAWQNVPVQADLAAIFGVPTIIENDANLGGLSEALLVKDEFKKVLYITISTGIGTGLIINGIIDPDFADSEGGQMVLEHNGQQQMWEHFASGKAIVAEYGKPANDITDPAAWQAIAHNIAVGLINLVTVIQPEIVIIGGGVGSHFDKFGDLLSQELGKSETTLTSRPVLRAAARPEESVIYGCYDLAASRYPAGVQ